jgi:hypothetical protein
VVRRGGRPVRRFFFGASKRSKSIVACRAGLRGFFAVARRDFAFLADFAMTPPPPVN